MNNDQLIIFWIFISASIGIAVMMIMEFIADWIESKKEKR